MVRILLVAPTCDGEDVGEAWVAYQWARELCAVHDVTLLTYHKRGRTPARHQLLGLRVIEWTEPPLVGRFERANSMLKPAYLPFYVRARKWIRSAQAAGEVFDVAHQPVPVSMRYPSPAAGLGIPLIIGPVGGGLPDPPGFSAAEETAPWFVRLRGLDQLRLRHDRLLRKTYQGADCVLGIAPYVRDLLRDIELRRFEIMSETGLTALPDLELRPIHDRPLQLLFVGRVIRTKGVRYAIAALARDGALSSVLHVVGDGPDREYCERLAEETGVRDRVTFHGRLPRSEVDDFYRDADVFVFPSYREPGGNVAFEAMGHGLPLIVCDRGGPGAAVDESCAFRLKVSTEAELVQDLATAIGRFAESPELVRSMGAAARRRVEETGLWSSRIDQFEAVVASLSPRP